MASVVIAGDTSGSITLAAPAVAGTNTLSLPAVTDTLVGLAATQTLTNKSIAASQLTGTIAAARLPAGSVLQVVSATTSSLISISGSTYTDSGLTASITPTSATSKIFVIVNQTVYIYRESSNTARSGVRLMRDSTAILNPNADGTGPINPYLEVTGATNIYFVHRYPMAYLDSPATTSAVTYKTQGRITGGGAILFQSDSGTSTITLMEIAA